ncbi:hypothetical protein JL720_14054 [Aureococcus anophagefferens]|nr:hypothetical protein JL720_14054 [Aureococcus anophagefferens]
MLGLEDVPVGVGSAAGASHRDTLSHLAAGYIAGADAAVEDGQALLARVFAAARDGSLTLLCISATDAREFLANEGLFLRKIREVVIMGGVAPSAAGLVPDTAANNAFDEAASAALYADLQKLRVPMVAVTLEAACPVPRRVYDDIAATGSPIGVRLQAAQRTSITALWRRTHASGAERLGLPERCGPAWFLDTFCGGAGGGRGVEDEVWDLVRSFNMYDAVALIAASPRLRREHFDPTVVAVGGAVDDERFVGDSSWWACLSEWFRSEQGDGPESFAQLRKEAVATLYGDAEGGWAAAATSSGSVVSAGDSASGDVLVDGVPVAVAPNPLVVVSDAGRTVDDELALVLLRAFAERGLVQPTAVVANVSPALARAGRG